MVNSKVFNKDGVKIRIFLFVVNKSFIIDNQKIKRK